MPKRATTIPQEAQNKLQQVLVQKFIGELDFFIPFLSFLPY